MNTRRTAQKTHKIMIFVTEKISDGLTRIAAQKGRPSADIAEELFLAAYAARHTPTGDKALDAAVAALDAPSASGDDKLRAEIRRLSNDLVVAAEREKLLTVANAEVANLSAEIGRLKASPAKQPALRIVPPAGALGSFLAAWTAEAGQVAA